MGQFRNLYIVSPDNSPNSSPENSQQISPNSTFRHDEQRHAKAGTDAHAPPPAPSINGRDQVERSGNAD